MEFKLKEEKKNSKKTNFGKYLKKLREDHNLSQGEVAEKVKASLKMVKKWELELEYPELDHMYRLAELYYIPVEEMLEYREETHENGKKITAKINKALNAIFISGRTGFVIALIIAIVLAFFAIPAAVDRIKRLNGSGGNPNVQEALNKIEDMENG